MISQEKKDQIDRDAESWAFLLYTFDTGRRYGKRGYVEGATNYAEKLEDLTEVYNTMSDIAHRKQIKILELEEQLTELKSWHDYYKERAEKGEGILKSATDIHFVPGKEGDNLLAAKDRELAQLKEIAERMGAALSEAQLWPNISQIVIKNSLTVYAEWCKQNLR